MNKQSLIYLPKKVSDEMPEGYVIAMSEKELHWSKIEFDEEFNSVVASNCESYFTPDEWLKPIKDVYVFSSEELLDLKKKWASEAWEVGKDWAYDCINSAYAMTPVPTNNSKETYLNNLKLD